MSRTEYLFWCFVLSVILGGCWGGFIHWFHPVAGISVGLGLFIFCFVVLANIDTEIEKEEQPQHNRRFNDV